MESYQAGGAGFPKPVANYPKQAVIVIHGMGEQTPMDTIKDLVRAVWETDGEVLADDTPTPSEAWSKPDVRTGSLELRRITTRQTKSSSTFPRGVRSDFYELYWADLSGGSTWSQVRDWIRGLLFRPFTRVPRTVRLAWVLLWILAAAVTLLAIATALPREATIGPIKLWEYWPLRWLSIFQTWQLALATAAVGALTHFFVVPYFGRVVRYTRAKPENIEARKNIRERGLALLKELHDTGDYERIVIVAHSLGSIVAYELINYFWAAQPQSHSVQENTPEFSALCALELAVGDLEQQRDKAAVARYHDAQRQLCRLLRRRPKPAPGQTDTRWLITDLVTVGSPLTHAEFLIARSAADVESRKQGREFPTSPPVRELLDPDVRVRAQATCLPVDANEPRLLCFPFGNDYWQLHHAAPYAVVRWTNIFDPAMLVFCGDIISGAIGQVFGPGIIDVNLKELRGQSGRFTHTRYWWLGDPQNPPPHLIELRRALDIAGQHSPV